MPDYSDDDNKKFYKGFDFRPPQYWLTPEGQEEKLALTEPSIMDEYIKQNDPEQWGRINAAQLQKYIESIGPAVASGKIPSKGIKGPNLPEDMSLLERIKLAAKRSNVKAPEIEAANLEREALKNKPKDFFEKAKQKDTNKILEENEDKLEKLKKILGSKGE